MSTSEDELLRRLLRAYAEELRNAATLTRHMGLAARAGDRVGFAAVKAEFTAATKRSEAWLLSIRICREMMHASSRSARPSGLSVVPAPAPVTALIPYSPAPLEFTRLNTNAA